MGAVFLDPNGLIDYKIVENVKMRLGRKQHSSETTSDQKSNGARNPKA